MYFAAGSYQYHFCRRKWGLSSRYAATAGAHSSSRKCSCAGTNCLLAIRVPRILAALFLGAALAGAGTTYQGMFRNPLVSPDILGVSAGAGLGACAAILWGLSIVYIQLYAFCGGLMVVAGVWLITRRVTRHDPILTLVLVGIALGTLCGAGISLIKTLADPYTQLPSITFWLLGGCPP